MRSWSRNVVGWIAAGVVAAAAPVGAQAPETPRMSTKPPRPPHELVSATHYTFTIFQNKQNVGTGQNSGKIGTETVTRSVFRDNTVVYESELATQPFEAVSMDHHSKLVLQDDSYFPIECELHKHFVQKGKPLDVDISIHMYANVAVVTTHSDTRTETRNVVVPSGAMPVETGFAHYYEQMLHWYDTKVGGRQRFDVIDISLGKPETAVLQAIAPDTITVAGKTIPAEKYLLEREKFPVNIWVDAKGRMVRVEQNFMTFDLTQWSEEPASEKAGSAAGSGR